MRPKTTIVEDGGESRAWWDVGLILCGRLIVRMENKMIDERKKIKSKETTIKEQSRSKCNVTMRREREREVRVHQLGPVCLRKNARENSDTHGQLSFFNHTSYKPSK